MSYVSVTNHNNEIHCWDRDENGDLHHTVHPEPMYLFVRNKKGGEYKSIYGEPMEKREFSTRSKMQKFIKENKHRVAESDVQPIYRFLLDNYLEAPITPYNVSFFDIEVDFDLEDGLGYPSIQNPFGEINSISIYDCHLQTYIMLVPKHLKGKIELKDERDGIPVETFWCPNERDMLLTFADCLGHVDIISAYNGDAFDIPYIMERAIICFGEDDASKMFCRNGVPAKKREFVNEYGEETWEWKLAGRTHLDMMKLFKKFHPGEMKSFALDAVCGEVLGEKKISYEDNLGELYRTDPQRFYDYSLHDSRLLKMLDEKKQIMRLAMMIIWGMCCTPYDIHGSIKSIEMGIIKYCRKKNIVVPDKKENNKDEQYAGAVVYDSIQGLHKWVISADLQSLYPKCMILLGLSPETMLFQCLGGYEDYVAIIEKDDSVGYIEIEDVKDGHVEKLLPSEIEEVIREEGYTISGSGTIFSGKMGLIASWLVDNFNQRLAYKTKMKELYDAGDNDGGDMYNLYQQVVKIAALNAVYGASGNIHFRFYDIRLAESVTLTAQIVSKAQAVYANQAVNMVLEE